MVLQVRALLGELFNEDDSRRASWSIELQFGSMVKRLRHRPFTAVTGVQIPLESSIYADMAQLAEQLICNQQVIGSSPIVGFIYYGWIPERPKGADCKSVVDDFDGSNPSPSTIY